MPTEARKIRDEKIDLEAACLVAAIVRVRIDQGIKPSLKLCINETFRMAHYLQDCFGREHFAYMADYDAVIRLLDNQFCKGE